MATPIMGYDLRVKFGTAGNGTVASIYGAIECSINIETDTIAVNHKDNESVGWEESEAGKNKWSASTNGLFYIDVPVDGFDIATAQIAKQKCDIDFSPVLSGAKKMTGKAIITSCEFAGTVGEIATYAVSFKGDGPLTLGTIA